ncbi:MAG: hypothetical protein C5B50_17015 [Verrucomicrobia bacterium]|nr:MAG: hypothetical protein C5B50_17015 [Verrucomicrobiota bacterium]
MKAHLFLKVAPLAGAVALTFCAPTISRADYDSTVLTYNPVGYWKLTEGASSPAPFKLANSGSLGSAADAFANATVVNGVAGKVNNCIQLTDTGPVGDCDSRADVVWNAGLNSKVFSVELWVNPGANFAGGDATGLTPLCNFSPNGGGGASRIGWLFYCPPSGPWNFRMGLTSGYAANLHATNGNPVIGTWQHIAATWDGTTVTMYINGQIAAAATASTPGFSALPNWVPNPNSFLRFGGTPLNGANQALTADALSFLPWNNGLSTAGNRGWDGLVDEVAIYTNALSAATILAHFNAAATPATYGATILADQPTGYWNFDESAVTVPSSFPTAANSGTVGATATATNLWGDVNGQAGPGYGGFSGGDKAVFFDGVSCNMAVADAPGLHFSGKISMAAWVKPQANNYYHDIIEHGTDGTAQETFLRITRQNGFSGGFVGNYGQASYYEVGSTEGELGTDNYYDGCAVPMPPGDIGNWVFLVGTFDGSQWNLYRNGVLAGTLAPDPEDLGAVDVTNAWSIGSRQLPSIWEGHRFAGTIAEPAIFTNVLGPSDVLALWNAAHVPPFITRAVTVPPGIFKGSPASFNVWAEGNATLSYLWLSNGISTGVTTTNYNISSLNAGPLTVAVAVNNSYGAITSSVSTVVVASKPLIIQQPVGVTRYTGRPFTLSVVAGGTQPVSYQWNANGSPISSATNSSYSGTVNASSAAAGPYSCTLTNEAGSSNTVSVAITSLAIPPGYESAVITNSTPPLAFWRLSEASGTVAHDYFNGNDGLYSLATLGQPGYSVIDPDTSVAFNGLNSYAGNISGTVINFTGTNASFTLEAWAKGTAGMGDESTVIGKGIGANGTTRSEQFSLDTSGGNYRFFTTRGNTLYEADANVGPNGTWQHVVAVYDQTTPGSPQMKLYVNGVLAGSGSGNPFGLNATTSAVSIGSKRTGNDPNYDGTFNGNLDEVAVYPYAMDLATVQLHYGAAYGGSLPPLITLQPQPLTNYAGLLASFFVGAGGTQPLNYQWKKGTSPLSDGGNISGSSSDTLVINPLALTDAGTYSVTINNVNGTSNSVPVVLTVLSAPASPPVIPGLVLHMTFNGTLADSSGRGNNGVSIHMNRNLGVTTSNTAAATYVNDGMPAGNKGFHFSTTALDASNTNFDNFYATLGKNPDELKFGTVADFSVAFWIRAPLNYVGNDLPFFTDGVGSTFAAPGIVFAYTFGTAAQNNPAYPGGWAYSVLDSANGGLAGRGEIGAINDGLWHHLVHVFDRKDGQATYLDGLAVPFHKQAGTSIQAATSFDNNNWWTIGQDPTGLYNQATAGISGPSPAGDIDDLGVWKKALSPLEAAAIFVAASSNNLSYVSAPLSFTYQRQGSNLILNWNAGVLQSATNAAGPYTDLTPDSPITNSVSSGRKFFRVKL